MKVKEFINRVKLLGCECDVRVKDHNGHEEPLLIVDGKSVTIRTHLPSVEAYLDRLVGEIQLSKGSITLHLKKPRNGAEKA